VPARRATFLRYTANTKRCRIAAFLYSNAFTRNKALKPQDIMEVCRRGTQWDRNGHRNLLRTTYGQAALRAQRELLRAAIRTARRATLTSNLYDARAMQQVSRRGASSLARLRKSDCPRQANPAEVFLDLGSGGGSTSCFSAKRFRPRPETYGWI